MHTEPVRSAMLADHNVLHHEPTGVSWALTAIAHHFGNAGVAKVNDAIAKARAASVPWAQIFAVLLPLVLSLFSGGSLDLAKIIEAILALIPKTP